MKNINFVYNAVKFAQIKDVLHNSKTQVLNIFKMIVFLKSYLSFLKCAIQLLSFYFFFFFVFLARKCIMELYVIFFLYFLRFVRNIPSEFISWVGHYRNYEHSIKKKKKNVHVTLFSYCFLSASWFLVCNHIQISTEISFC